MAKVTITKTMVIQRIVKNLQKEKVYVTRLGKQIIPKDENDLPPRMKLTSYDGVNNPEYRKAHQQIYYELRTKPSRNKRKVKIKISKTQIYEGILSLYKKDEVLVDVKGKMVIPITINELPKDVKQTHSPTFKNMYQRLYYKQSRKNDSAAEYKAGRWSKVEEQDLKSMYYDLATAGDMSSRLNRTSQAVTQKLYVLRKNGELDDKVSETPIMLAETIPTLTITEPTINEPMEAYRQVARTGRVSEDTFSSLVNEYAKSFKITHMSKTPEGSITVYWEK